MLKKALTFLFMFAAMAAFAQERVVPSILPKPTSVKPGNANTRARYIYIHGTNDTEHLGTPVSHGCIRLSPQDMLRLFEQCPLGEKVKVY